MQSSLHHIPPWIQEDWRQIAACQDLCVDLFFPRGTTGLAADQIMAAKAICRQCAVRENCLDFALETNQECGIFGGLDEQERRLLRRKRQAKNQVS